MSKEGHQLIVDIVNSNLLDGARIPGPYVLIGHSTVGLHVLRFAEISPEEVAGVVLLDTPPPGFETRCMELLTPDERERRRRIIERGLE